MSEVETGELPETDATVAEPVEGSAESTPQEADESQSKVQKRINKLTWEKHEEQRRADALEARLQSLEAQKPNPSEALADVKAPNYADFDTDEAYNAAMQSYTVETYTRLHEQEKETQTRQQAEVQARQRQQDYQAKVAAYAAENDAFIEVVSRANFNVEPHLQDVLMQSGKPAELTHYLAEHPDDVIRFNSMSPTAVALELGAIEARYVAAAPKKISSAPPPQTDLDGADISPQALSDDMDADDWVAKRRQQLREKGKL